MNKFIRGKRRQESRGSRKGKRRSRGKRRRKRRERNREENKAGYTATPVAYGWAGAVFELT